ncbi:MAG: tRNA dihydrouridine synthase DusB [bacterium]
MQIGRYAISGRVVLAPMAGITDLPFRKLCRSSGAAMATSEMTIANKATWTTDKTRLRLRHEDEPGPIVMQIAGGDVQSILEAAQHATDNGADIIDINMGCPAKKVFRKLAGSALMANEALVEEILTAVITQCDVPVTLKIRTGIEPNSKNASNIAHIAERAGISSLAIHGRTRACLYKGDAEHRTAREVRDIFTRNLIINGDIIHPQTAPQLIEKTGADGLMIGRAAQGNPWIFSQFNQALEDPTESNDVDQSTHASIALKHIQDIHQFYTGIKGVRIARKHIGWYLEHFGVAAHYKKTIMQAKSTEQQLKDFAHALKTNYKIQTP